MLRLDVQSWSTLIGFIGVTAIAAFIFSILFTRDALQHVPGPWSARFTSLAVTWAELRGEKVQYYSHLHHRYGPVVRVSPAEVSFSNIESFKAIHKIGANFTKDASYNIVNVSFGKYNSVLSIREPKPHNERRRLFAKALSASHLRRHWQGVVSERVDLAVKRIRRDLDDDRTGRRSGIDVAKWWKLMASDIATWLSFGSSFECLEAGEMVPYLQAIEIIPFVAILYVLTPSSLRKALEMLPLPSSVRFFFDIPELLMSQGKVAVEHSKATSSTKNIFADAVSECEKEGGSLPDVDIQTEAGTFIVAGTGTSSDALQCLVWSVLSQPDLQRALEDEVSSVQDMSDESLEQLPILNAVIDETLRLFGSGAGPLPRLAPSGGRTIHGMFIPEGTVVSASAFFFHRDPAVFPDPLRFDHTRFLPANSPAAKKALMAPFGGGTRICIGLHLALMVLRRATVEFFRECRGATLAPSMHGVEMGFQSRFFATTPAYPKLDIIWKEK